MTLQEWTEAEAIASLEEEQAAQAVLIYTPLCGTCNLAERMLGLAAASGAAVPVHKVNINFAPGLRDRWQISSVPCLLLAKPGQPIRREYALHSVPEVYALLKGLE